MWCLALAVLGNMAHFSLLKAEDSPRLAANLTTWRDHIVTFMQFLMSSDCHEFWNSPDMDITLYIHAITLVLSPVFGHSAPHLEIIMKQIPAPR